MRSRAMLFLGAWLASACSPAAAVRTPSGPQADTQPLAKFMREAVNVPFSFALLEREGAHGLLRVHKAALVLNDAARDLGAWKDPPIESAAGRAVFFAYARNLERGAALLEVAARNSDAEAAAYKLEDIRQTCNSCHRFFRPASRISPDVGFDVSAFSHGVDRW